MIVPNYYKNFKCIADKCKHSCCIGWEIDIDSDTQMFYSVLPGEIGDKIRNNISNDLPPHFVLRNNKCPFLNEKGLCDIILNYGDDAVCEICREHPRFYNEYKNFTEAGIGLCCEAAAEIILKNDTPFALEGECGKLSKNEKEFLAERDKCFKILQNRTLPFVIRLQNISKEYGIDFNEIKKDEMLNKFKNLERLSGEWSLALDKANTDISFNVFVDFAVNFEQFATYLIYRHFIKAYEQKNFADVVNFVINSCFLLAFLLGGKYDFAEIARMFSSEVEYSEKNLAKILN